MLKPTIECSCNGTYLETEFSYDTPPVGETPFDIGDQTYNRSYSKCVLCGHRFSVNPMDLRELYGGAYVDITYGDRLKETFERILVLPPQDSDNAGRVATVLEFSGERFGASYVPSLVDIGSGLCVFAYRMKEAGWRCTVIDPDPRAAKHARETVGVHAVTGDFMKLDTAELGHFDVVTLNKVLEHVVDPLAMLARTKSLLSPRGFVYLEVPDAEAAAAEGPVREEFFVEHHHVFSIASTAMLAGRAGLRVVRIQRLREPSGKFTIRTFLDCVAQTSYNPKSMNRNTT